MAQYQEFEKGNIRIRYFKEPNVLYLMPEKGANKESIKLLKNQLETFLTVDSLKTQNNGFSLKLSDMNTVSIPEVLKAIGASGGEEIEDAASIAQEPSEKEVKETEKQTGQPQMPQMPQQPGMEPDMGMGQMPLAAGLTPKIYCILYENMFGDPTFGKPRKPGRRTGKYWKPIERITGKNRAKINDKDILSKRKEYARKPENEDRNKVLRSLDRAFDYFYDKIEETSGRQSAERYAEDYHAIDNLNPKDYSLEKHEPEPIGPEEPLPETSPDEINGPDFVDFADVLSRDDDSYEDIEIEEETY